MNIETTPGSTAPGDGTTPRVGGVLRPLLSFLAAAVCAVAIVGLSRLAVGTASGQRLDQLIFSGATEHEGRLSTYAEIAVGTVSVPVVSALLALAVVLVLVRRRPGQLVGIATLVLGANLTTQVIKRLLVTREALGPGIDLTPNSFPSGHTTLAATAIIALVLAGGRSRVVLAPVGAVWTAAAGIGTLVVGWHRPSDVVGAITVVAAWTFLILALEGMGVRRRRARAAARPDLGRRRRDGAPIDLSHRPRLPLAERAVAVLLMVLGAAGLVVGGLGLASLPRPLELDDAALQVSSFVDTAVLIGGGTAAWMALTLLLRAPTSHRRPSAERVP